MSGLTGSLKRLANQEGRGEKPKDRKEINVNIELSEKEAKFLKQFALKQGEGAKDNAGTMTPIHVVERIRKEFIEDGSGEAWIDACEEYGYEAYESFDDLISARRENGEDLPLYKDVYCQDVNDVFISDEKEYCEAYGISVRSGRYFKYVEPVAFFFTLDEAKRYKNEYQSHNCSDCRIYTYGLGYSNKGDMPSFRALLMRMGQQILSEGRGSNFAE